MLERLLESRFKAKRSVGGTIASVTGHTALVAAALYATARTHVRPRVIDALVRVAYVIPLQPTGVPTPARSAPGPSLNARQPVFVDVRIPDMIHLPIEAGSIVARPGDFARSSDGGGTVGIGSPQPSPDAVWRADQVETQVGVVPGGSLPRYPEALRLSGVEGRVVAVFVVDEQGRAEAGSIFFPHSDNELFEREVRATLRQMRFIPAEVAGRKVRQLVEMPFVFRLTP